MSHTCEPKVIPPFIYFLIAQLVLLGLLVGCKKSVSPKDSAPLPMPEPQTFAAGSGHSLFLCNRGTVNTWGWNFYGQLGNGQIGGVSDAHPTPGNITNLNGIKSVGAGYVQSYAIKNDETVWAWGSNATGELGDGTTADRSNPVLVSLPNGIVSIAGGQGHSLALRNHGSVWAWGWNATGELGDGTTIDRSAPIKINSLSSVVAIAAGYRYSLALAENGTVWTWGNNEDGELGDGTTMDRHRP